MKGNEIMKKKFFAIAALIFWCCVVFFFSSQSADESTKRSDIIVKRVECADEGVRAQAIEDAGFSVTGLVRKTAHIIEYGVLASAAYFVFRRFSWAFAFSAMYAASDEIHQIFVPGRGPRVTDVAIDSIGAMLALSAIYAVKTLIERPKKGIGNS